MYSNMMNIIGAKCNIGQLKKGVELGPIAIKEELLNRRKNNFNYSHVNIKSLNGYYDLMNVHKFQRKPITIGGDHSIAMATIGSSLQKYDNLKVLWLDAHADIHTPESSESKNLHGMPLSTLLGNSAIINLPVKLKRENLVYIGLRDIDKYESKELDTIKWFSSKCVHTKGISKILDEINYCKSDNIHLSLDVDVIDPTHFPATGTTVPHGISCEHVSYVIDILKDNIIALDIVEYNPLINDDPKCKEFIIDCIKLL